MDKHYHVFLSSAFGNGTEELRAAVSALLDLNCWPAGANLPDLHETGGWPPIERLIRDSDYVMLILGRELEQHTALDNLEREYACAVEKGKPVIAFLQSAGAAISGEPVPHPPCRLHALRSRLEQGICRHWSTPPELGGAVSRAFSQLQHSQPAEGWVRGSHARTEEDYRRSAQLAEEVLTLQRELAGLRAAEPPIAANLACGGDKVELEYSLRGDRAVYRVSATWNELFAVVASAAIRLPATREIAGELSAWIGQHTHSLDVEVSDAAVGKIRLQFFALGLIEMRPFGPERMWALTAAGRTLLGELQGEKSPAAGG